MNHRTEQATGAAARQAHRDHPVSERSTPESITHPTPHPTPRSALLASCVCAVLAGGPAAALELGEPVVRSGLGQPLEVVVPYATWGNERLTAECVSLVRGDAGGLPALTAGRVSSTAGNRLVIRSDRGIREPLLGLSLKVDCPATPFIVRSYTLIIDPPGLAPATQAPAPIPAPRRDPAEPAAVLPSASSAPRASRDPAPSQPLDQGSEYRVRVGDTLSTIAQRVSDRPTGIWATAERIFAANPDAFIDGNMDRLRAGSVLVIPVLDGAPATAATGPNATAPDAKTPAAAATGPAATDAPADDGQARAADSGRSAASSAAAAATPASAERIRPAVRQAMDEMAAAGTDAGGAAETPSPFKAADGGETAPEAVLTPAGPAPDVAAPEPAPRSSVSPLFAALFGAGIGLLMGLVIFRSSVREFLRRAPAPAGRRGGRSPGP
ncbi:MAG: LysM peptidoglycan-binding domain-containing protein [Gammaproteobacteria bacterium]|nr:LysM peptidoglycan-binding domain-containing protein [Gammaproteobacteria bacterium]